MQVLREVPFFEWNDDDPITEIKLDFSPGRPLACYDKLLTKDTGLYRYQSSNSVGVDLSIYIFWRIEKNALTVQEYCLCRNCQPKYRIVFPISIVHSGAYVISTGRCIIFYIVTVDNFIYSISGDFQEDGTFAFHFDSIKRDPLDNDVSPLQHNTVTQFHWNECSLCRQFGTQFVLLNRLQPTVEPTIFLTDSQNRFTRTLRHFFNPSNYLLDVTSSTNQLYFLFSTGSLHIFSLQTFSWESSLSLPLEKMSHPIRSGRMVANEDLLLFLFNNGEEDAFLVLCSLSPFHLFPPLSLPTPPPMVSMIHPSIAHPSSFLPSAHIEHISLCPHSQSYLPSVLCSWKRDDYIAISLIQFYDMTDGSHTHLTHISLSDHLKTLFRTIESSFSTHSNDFLTIDLQNSIDNHFIESLSNSPILPYEVCNQFRDSQNRADFCQNLHMTYAQRKMHLETVGSEMTQIHLYLTIWREMLHQILLSAAAIFSLHTDFNQLLVAHWHGVSSLMPIDVCETPDYQSFSQSAVSRLIELSNDRCTSLQLPFASSLQWQRADFSALSAIENGCPALDERELNGMKKDDIIDAIATLTQSIETPWIQAEIRFSDETPLVGIPAESRLYNKKLVMAATNRFYRGIALLYLTMMIKNTCTFISNDLEATVSTLLEAVSRCAGFINLFRINMISDIPKEDIPSGNDVFCEYYTLLERDFHQDRITGDAQQWETFLFDRFTRHNTEFIKYLLNRHFSSLAIAILSPLISTPLESIPVETRHMFVEACFQCGGRYREKGVEIEKSLMQGDLQEFYFALRSAYANEMFDLVEEWCVTHEQFGFPHLQAVPVLIIWYRALLEINRIKDAASILQKLPRESALLQLPLFVNLLCDKGQISTIADIDFGNLQSDIQRQILVACSTHNIDSSIFLSAYKLFYHQKAFRLSLLPLFLLLNKIHSSPPLSSPSLDLVIQEFRILGLMVSTFAILPESERYIEMDGIIITESFVLHRMVEVEATLSTGWDPTMNPHLNPLLHPSKHPSAWVETLAEKGEFHLAGLLIDQGEEGELKLVHALARFYLAQNFSSDAWVPTKRDYACILMGDASGRRIAEFVRVLVEEKPNIGFPPFVEEMLIEMMDQGSNAYSMVIAVLLRLGRVENACRLFCIAGERRSVWISETLKKQLLFVLEEIVGSEHISNQYKAMMKSWQDRIRAIKVYYTDE